MRKINIIALLLMVACSVILTADTIINTMSWTGVDREMVIYDKWAKEYSAKHPGVTVKFEPVSSSYGEKLLTMFAGGTPPDFFYTGLGEVPLYAAKGMLEPLDKFASSANGFDFKDLVSPEMQVKVKGQTYGWAFGFGPYVLFYNKAMFDAAKVKYPTDDWTWKDVTDAAKKLTLKKGGNVVQFGFQADEYNRVWMSYIWSHGGKLFDDDIYPTKVLFNDAIGVAAIKWLGDMVTSFSVAPPPGMKGALSYREAFENQKVAMIMDGSWMMSQFNAKKDLNYGIAMIPKGTAERKVWGGSCTWAVSAPGKNKDIAWDVMKTTYNSKDAQLEMSDYGGKSALNIPSLKSALNDPRWKPTEIMTVVTRQAKYARPEPMFLDEGRWAWELVGNAVQELMLTKKDPKVIINELADKTTKEILANIK